MDFRKDINGLRAFAVTIVVLYHFGVYGFSGGFSGVDIFFVISGYLMTRIIFSRVQSGNFSLLGFYVARAKRIIPALLALCLALSAYGWYNLIPSEYAKLGNDIYYSSIFYSNVNYFLSTNYFDAVLGGSWLLHTWSLSVEWQFYIIYPIIVYLAYKITGKNTKYFLVLLLLLSLAISVYYSESNKTAAFYLLQSRAWEMLLGGMAFLFKLNINARNRKVLSIASLTILVYCTIFYNSSMSWPGYAAILPTLATALIINLNSNLDFAFNNKPTQKIGEISYSIYLWHWPVVVVIGSWGLIADVQYKIIGIISSIIFGVASYYAIETPARNVKLKNNIALLIIYLGLCYSMAMVGKSIFDSAGYDIPTRPSASSEKAKFLEKYTKMHYFLKEVYMVECDFYDGSTQKHKEFISNSCTSRQGSDKSIFLWGDSHAQALSYGIRKTLHSNYDFYQVATSDCRPSLADSTKERISNIDNACKQSNLYALKKIYELKPDVVVIAQQADHEKTDWVRISNELLSYGVKKVVIVGPTIQWNAALPQIIYNSFWNDKSGMLPMSYVKESVFKTNDIMKSFNDRITSYSYVDSISKMCIGDRCIYRFKGIDEINQFDSSHLTKSGSIEFSKIILNNYIY
ncbi:acyltransferase family protein [Yersinia kristensenii]|uniref:acyltransferase family protein n=1 Tax=Yersinia kristensenii TaxID=28152 RepID=UPI0011A48ED3|nr:acyltransferase family protein [Yersinia kristensenii]